MPVNRNALIRYTTIDKCLRNRYRKWSFDDLLNSCSEALFEHEGIDKGISPRTLREDIKNLRSEKLGFNAPIITYDKKYYTYKDPNYSILNIQLKENEGIILQKSMLLLQQFADFNSSKQAQDVLESINQTTPTNKHRNIIYFDKNTQAEGKEYLDELLQRILNKECIDIRYRSFHTKKKKTITLHPYILKESNKRWYIVGKKNNSAEISSLALDRIHSIQPNNEIKWMEDVNFDPEEYYEDVIGISTNKGLKKEKILIRIDAQYAPFILSKPMHHSQKLISRGSQHCTISIEVVPNWELERLLLGYSEKIKVLSPTKIQKRIAHILNKAAQEYRRR